jgi:GLPGLI family protein
MKKMMLLLAVAGITHVTCVAQDKSQGKIDYEVTLNLHASMKPDQLQYKDMVPEKVVNKEVLYFNGSKTRLSRKDPDEITSDEGAKVKIVTNEGQIAVYTDGATGQSWSLIEEEGKKTLVPTEKREKVDKVGNKPGTRTKEILGFICRELTVKSKDDGVMTLWVTDAFPFSAGPMGLSAEKGLVLGVDSKKLSVMATAINYSPVSISEVSIPDVPVKSGKKYTF